MSGTGRFKKRLFSGLAVFVLAGAMSSIGCQVSENGQTLPAPDYLDNQVHYSPAGAEHPLIQEVMHMERIDREQSYNDSYHR